MALADYQMGSILITGSTGILGKHVIARLNEIAPTFKIMELPTDIRNFRKTKDFCEKIGAVSHVIHLAASVEINKVNANPADAYRVNLGGTINLLTALAELGLKPHIFMCSSSHVYSPVNIPLSEESELNPSSLYGRTKMCSEIAASDICDAHGLQLCIGRVFSMHDPDQKGSFLRPNISRRLENENLSEPFKLQGADSVRDFLSAQEVAKYVVDLSLKCFEGTINIASGKPMSVGEFVQSLSSKKLNISNIGSSNSIIADITKLRVFEEEYQQDEQTFD